MTGHAPAGWPQVSFMPILNIARLMAGFIGLILASTWIGLTNNALPFVPAIDQRVFEPTESTAWKIMMVLVLALSMVAVTGVWTPRRVDVGQALGAVCAGLFLAVSADLLYSSQFSGPGAVCTYSSCWPSPYQELAILTPAALAFVTMMVLAFVGRPSRAAFRAVVPALVLLVLTGIQHLAWRATVLPILLGPPPT